MLHYKGLIAEQPGIKAKPIEDNEKDITETLMFYDDELHADSCILVQEKLEEHFKSDPDDVYVQVYYEKEDDRVIIGMTIFFNNMKIGQDYLIIDLNLKDIIKTHFPNLQNYKLFVASCIGCEFKIIFIFYYWRNLF